MTANAFHDISRIENSLWEIVGLTRKAVELTAMTQQNCEEIRG